MHTVLLALESPRGYNRVDEKISGVALFDEQLLVS